MTAVIRKALLLFSSAIVYIIAIHMSIKSGAQDASISSLLLSLSNLSRAFAPLHAAHVHNSLYGCEHVLCALYTLYFTQKAQLQSHLTLVVLKPMSG